jgi:hypothetical protein
LTAPELANDRKNVLFLDELPEFHRRTGLVCGTNGENRIKAEGRTQAMAWRGACE